MRARSVLALFVLAACGDPRGGDAGPALADAGAGACPADVARAEGAACERPGLTCASPACASDRCAPGCVRLVCAEAPDGDRFAREAACQDAGPIPDAAILDSAIPDAGPPGPCAPLGADAARLVHDTDTSANAAAIAWDGTHYAVVWHALRSLEPVIYSLWFARVDREGAVVPGSVRRLFDDAGQQLGGALALGDGVWGLAYVRGATSGLTETNRVWVARLGLDGAPLDGDGAPVGEEHPPHHAHAIAWSPERAEWLVAWEGTEPIGGGFVNHHVYGTRVGADGVPIAGAVRLDALTTARFPGEGALVWTGDRFAVGLAEYQSVTETRVVVAELDPATAAPVLRIVLADRTSRPGDVVVATDGARYAVAWEDLEPTPTVWMRRAAVGGDATGDAVQLGGAALPAYSPSATSGLDDLRVVFHEGDATSASAVWARYAWDGTVLDAPAPVAAGTPPYGSFPRMGTDGCNDAVLWTAISEGDPSPAQDSEIRLQMVAGR